MITGYCVKCKEKGVELSAPEIHQTSKGGYMAKGKHEKCGTTVCAMMSKENAEKAIEDGATPTVGHTYTRRGQQKGVGSNNRQWRGFGELTPCPARCVFNFLVPCITS